MITIAKVLVGKFVVEGDTSDLPDILSNIHPETLHIETPACQTSTKQRAVSVLGRALNKNLNLSPFPPLTLRLFRFPGRGAHIHLLSVRHFQARCVFHLVSQIRSTAINSISYLMIMKFLVILFPRFPVFFRFGPFNGLFLLLFLLGVFSTKHAGSRTVLFLAFFKKSNIPAGHIEQIAPHHCMTFQSISTFPK